MDAKLKKKWVKALLSGEYKQGVSMLYSEANNKWCCLGVLGDVIGFPKDRLRGGCFLTHKYAVNGMPLRLQGRLADLNDEGVPFDMIAGLIDGAL